MVTISTAQRGFTLIELSIALVIISLLIGGVLTGQSLIQSSELQSVITDEGKFVTAVNVFDQKYNALPGDMTNATSFWGTDSACPNTPYNTTSKQATCNGDGNGSVDGNYESFRFWQQLANAGLIRGSYTGAAGQGASWEADIGLNVPASRIANSGYLCVYFGAVSGDPNLFDGNYGHVCFFGAGWALNWPLGPAITAREAYGLDQKVDDGQPASGKVMGFKSSFAPGCTTANDASARYAVTVLGVKCNLAFTNVF